MRGYTTTTFIDDVVAGRAVETDLDDYIEYWHTHQTGNGLNEYLGMTQDEYGGWLTNDSLLSELIRRRLSMIVRVPYVSVWDGGVEVESMATVNIKTGEITDVDTVNIGGLDICESEYVVMNDEHVYVYQNEHGFELWVDIHNEYKGE